MRTEAQIQVSRKDGKLHSVAVVMPIWDNKRTEFGNLKISIPLLGLETIAKNDEDSEEAIKEAITCFCLIAEKFGQGIEKELHSLGWSYVDGQSGKPIMGYDVKEPDSVIDRILQTGDNYINQNLELEFA